MHITGRNKQHATYYSCLIQGQRSHIIFQLPESPRPSSLQTFYDEVQLALVDGICCEAIIRIAVGVVKKIERERKGTLQDAARNSNIDHTPHLTVPHFQ